jgi:hypothetical protein
MAVLLWNCEESIPNVLSMSILNYILTRKEINLRVQALA